MSGARYDRRDDRYRDDGRARRDDRGGGHRDRRDDDRRDPAPRRDRSRSRDRRPPIPHRSRSPTPDRRLQRRRPTLFDVPPDGEIGVQMPGGGVGVPPGLRGLSSATDHSQIGLPPGMGLVGGVQTGGVPPGPPGVGAAPQATRHARRLYVGSLPPSANEFSTSTFFNQALRAVSGAVENTPGDPVLNAYFNVEKRFAFVEFRSIIETSNALGLDGVVMDGQAIRIRRPNDYNAAAAAALGPSLPSQSLNLAMVGMAGVVGAAGGATNTTAPVSAEDQANRLFIGGLPYFLTDQMVKELVEAFGVTKSFKLVIDPETGNSKGYGFFVYQDPSVTDVACQGLHGMKMGEKTLTVKRAGESKGAASQGTAAPQAPAGYGYAVPGGDGAPPQNLPPPPPPPAVSVTPSPAPPSNPPSHVVFLSDMFEIDELRDDQEFADIEEDVRDECGKFGAVVEVAIPRPAGDGNKNVPGLGKAFVRYETVSGAAAARDALHGRKFGGKTVNADFIGLDAFERRAF